MTRLLVGAYSDNQNSDGPQEFSAWLGATQDLDSIFTGQANASDYETSVNYAIGVQNWSGAKHVSLPLLYSNGPTLAQAGSGSMDSEWSSAIQSVLSALPNQAIIYLRTAWEFNGNYELWASPPGNEGIFVTAWQRFAGIARSLDTKNQLRLVWCFNVGLNNPGPSYPGNAYVDVIGIDIYWQPGQPTDFPSWMLNVQYGLSYLASLGQQYGKPICIPELGLGSNGLAQSTTDLFTWAQANNMAYMNLWDSNLAYGPGGQLSQNQYPATGAAFRTAALAVINGTSSGSSSGSSSSSSSSSTTSSTSSPSTGTTAMAEANLLTASTEGIFDDLANAHGLGPFAIMRGRINVRLAVVWLGGGFGANQSNTIRTATTSAINLCFALGSSLGKILEWDEGTYETNGTIAVNSGVKSVGDINVYIVCYGTNIPIMTLGSITTANLTYGIEIDGLNLQYGSDQTGNSNACGIIQGGVYLSRFKNISIGSNTSPGLTNAPMIGWHTNCSVASTSFSNYFENITINEAQAYFMTKDIAGTGDTHVNMYFHNGSGSSNPNALSGNALYMGPNGQRSDDVWIRLNIEWCTPSNPVIQMNNVINCKFIGTHFEGVVLGGSYPALVSQQGGSSSFESTEILDLHTASSGYTRAATLFQMQGYNESIDLKRTWVKWSNASELNSATSVFAPPVNNANDNQAMITNDDFVVNDNGTGNAANLFLDANLTTPFSVLQMVRRHMSDALMSTTENAQFYVGSALTVYGQHKDAIVTVPASASAFTLTLHTKRKASGTGSTMPTAYGNTLRFRRQTGTVGGTVTIADSTAGTITTDTTSGDDLLFWFNGTAWTLAA